LNKMRKSNKMNEMKKERLNIKYQEEK
jgi:hypothetical protein